MRAAVSAERGGGFTARLVRLDGEALDRSRLGTETSAARAGWSGLAVGSMGVCGATAGCAVRTRGGVLNEGARRRARQALA